MAGCGESSIGGMVSSMCVCDNGQVKTKFKLAILICSIGWFSCTVVGQTQTDEKFQHAIERSQDAARILSLLNDPNSGFPRELIAKARLVAVFPHLAREDMLVRKYLHGYGVLSAGGENGWSLPAFYQFESAPRKFTGSSQENFGLILLFMNHDALSWLDKDKSEFKHERAAVIGPVGDIKGQVQIANQILAYTYYNGKVNGKIDADFFSDFILDQDNNINTPVYKMKGREVLSAKQIDLTSVPAGMTAFHDVLDKNWPR